MLGWEFPPFIAGGLGVACHGLTKALDRMGHEVLFILPRPVDRSQSSHIRLLSPDAVTSRRKRSVRRAASKSRMNGSSVAGVGDPRDLPTACELSGPDEAEFEHVRFRGVEASFTSPYPSFGDPGDAESGEAGLAAETAASWAAAHGLGDPPGADAAANLLPRAQAHYQGDLIGDAERYARLVVALSRYERFDVIHAHDWLTYPAGQALASISGRPLIVHVHSTEFDRAGENVNRQVYDIERRGMHAADRVVAVSMYTKSLCVSRYGVSPSKVDVVYNGIDREAEQPRVGDVIGAEDRIVLFLGRITMQKGPEYFIAAAKRVLEKVDNVKFVVAGSGDMAHRMIELAAAMGIGHRFVFTGFLRGRDVERVFRMADCYVMPSVSEPFGLSALEAIHNDVPVIISKQSGVSEVLTHALKVDFWDTDEMANKIVAVLRHPPLSEMLRRHGEFELRRLTWEGAGERCVRAYQRAMAARSAPVPA